MSEPQYIHLFSSDDKLKWFGYGEWVEEYDYATFEHSGILCKIVRPVIEDYPNNTQMFGGHFCGYCKIPENHIDYNCKDYSCLDYEVHGGLTYRKPDEDKNFWIGFDCAHLGDIIPSIIKIKKDIKEEPEKMLSGFGKKDNFNSILFSETYKNIEFVEKECKSLAQKIADRRKSPDG